MRQLGLDEVTFLPAGAPWQKANRLVTPPRHRWAMTELAIDGVDYFSADDREIHRDGPTYTIDTLEELGEERVVLILGADAAAGLQTWHRWTEVLDRARVAVVPRLGTDRGRAEAAADCVWLDMPELDISGSDLRHRLATGGSARFLVRESVWAYITDEGLYVDS